MQPSRPQTVHVSPAADASVFHTTPRCRHCPPSSRAVSRAVARGRGFVECETCYEDRVHTTGVPFTLVSSPREPMPAVPARVDGSTRERVPGDD
jgi:hypothetical protein